MPFLKSNAFLRAIGRLNSSHIATVSAGYRRLLRRNPFLSFGLPFVATVVAGSFFLTPVTAVRYEKHDRKSHTLDWAEATREHQRGIGAKNADPMTGDASQDPSLAADVAKLSGQQGRKRPLPKPRFKEVDIREEYFVCHRPPKPHSTFLHEWPLHSLHIILTSLLLTGLIHTPQKLAGNPDRLDNWEPVRVKRLPGEPDGVFD